MTPFGEEHAAIYDSQFKGISAARDGLQLITRLGLAHLPERASILCAGAGTGIEALTLGAAYPGWHFHLVDPAPAMLDVARRRMTGQPPCWCRTSLPTSVNGPPSSMKSAAA